VKTSCFFFNLLSLLNLYMYVHVLGASHCEQQIGQFLLVVFFFFGSVSSRPNLTLDLDRDNGQRYIVYPPFRRCIDLLWQVFRLSPLLHRPDHQKTLRNSTPRL
jgi:hypothetical protein